MTMLKPETGLNLPRQGLREVRLPILKGEVSGIHFRQEGKACRDEQLWDPQFPRAVLEEFKTSTNSVHA
jgi:hypothetical protein